MPEGHTIHRAARDQTALLAGRTVRSDSPQGRFDEGAALVDGRELRAIEAWGKHLFYDFGEVYVHVHLGLFGRFRTGRGEAPEARGAVRWRLRAGHGTLRQAQGDMSGAQGDMSGGAAVWMTLSGATVCEVVDGAGRKRVLARLGPDPLRANSRPAAAYTRIARSSVAVGALVMDQSVVAGIGNVYRAELLFRAKIAPQRPGADVEADEFARLWRDARVLLRAGVEDRRMITTRPADRPHPRGTVRRDERFYVYHRTGKPCFICGTAIRSGTMAARTVYWCPVCQR